MICSLKKKQKVHSQWNIVLKPISHLRKWNTFILQTSFIKNYNGHACCAVASCNGQKTELGPGDFHAFHNQRRFHVLRVSLHRGPELCFLLQTARKPLHFANNPTHIPGELPRQPVHLFHHIQNIQRPRFGPHHWVFPHLCVQDPTDALLWGEPGGGKHHENNLCAKLHSTR